MSCKEMILHAACRCYAAVAEASVWEASFNQLLQVSASFGFEPSTPYIRDDPSAHTCYNKLAITPTGSKIFTDCASVDAKDGALCAYNQLKGTCSKSICVTSGTVLTSDQGALFCKGRAASNPTVHAAS